MFASEISNEELLALPRVRFEGVIHVIDHPGAVPYAIERLKASPVLGFDTETRPTFAKGEYHKVALVQLATADEVFLFRLCKIVMPRKLRKLLSNPNILKIGTAISNDIDTLKRSADFTPKGFIDLQDMMPEFNIKNIGLAKMSGIILGAHISKTQQRTNWEKNILSEAQLRYAATDAWMCYMIYEKLKQSRMKNVSD